MVAYHVDKLVIRPATAADAEAIGEMWEALVTFHEALDPDLPTAAPDGGERYANLLVNRLNDSYTRAFVAEEDNRLVGFVLGMVVDLVPDMFAQEPCGFLADIYVDAAYRRRGIGRALVEALVDWFAKSGVPYFDWHVAAHNPEGLAFWQALGGREIMVRMRVNVGDQR